MKKFETSKKKKNTVTQASPKICSEIEPFLLSFTTWQKTKTKKRNETKHQSSLCDDNNNKNKWIRNSEWRFVVVFQILHVHVHHHQQR